MRLITRIGIITSIFFVLILSQFNVSSAYAVSGSYQNLDGTNINYSSYEGQFVFLEGFSTTCHFCWDQHPIIDDLYDAYGTEITFISIAIFRTIDTIQTLTDYVVDYPTAWHMGLDDGNLKDTMGITGTPSMFLLDKAGNVLERFNGFTEKNTLVYAFEIHVRENTDATQPTSTNSISGNPNDESLISNIVRNPIFQMASIIVIVAVIYVKTTGGKSV